MPSRGLTLGPVGWTDTRRAQVRTFPRRRLAPLAGLLALLVSLAACGSLSPRSSRAEPLAVTSSDSPTPSLVDDSPTPTPTAHPTSASPTSMGSSAPPTKPKPADPGPGPGPMIVIDPGHSGRSIRSTDKRTGLRDIDY